MAGAQELRQMPPREAVPPEHCWNAESVFPTPAAFDAAFEQARAELARAADFRGRLGEGPTTLADFFAYREALTAAVGKLRVYAGMAYSTNTLDAAAAARIERLRDLEAAYQSALAFAEPELIAVGLPTLRSWVASEPRLAHYHHYLERLEQRAAHLRTAEVEELLGELSAPFASAVQAHGVLANTDLTFTPAVDAAGREYEIGQGTIRRLLSDPDRVLRESAYRNYADAHLQMRNTMAQLLATGVRQNNFLARARRYPSALHAALEPEKIALEVFHQLHQAFRDNLPTWHRYWRAKKRLLGLERFAPWDIFAPLSPSSPEIPYEQAVEWLAEAMAPLGEAYVNALRRGALDERWVDRYPNRGKRMGAFSSGVQGTYPFIMMSYSDDVFGMSTLAHELGHSLHSYFTWQTQPPVYSRYSLFVAEVASNFNQAMLRSYLLERVAGDRQMELAILEEAMANFYRYFLVMPTLSRFELELHERVERGEALSADGLSELMADLFAEAYGDAVEVDRARVGITWAQFHTHLYSRFYTYQYATGIAGAHALAAKVRAGAEGAAERYLEFLRAGGSLYPLDALAAAGVDLTSREPVDQAFAVLASLVDRLEALGDG